MVILEVLAEVPKTSVVTTALGWVLCAMGWLGTAAMGLALADRIKKLERKGKGDGEDL
jgi:hypothetical protein